MREVIEEFGCRGGADLTRRREGFCMQRRGSFGGKGERSSCMQSGVDLDGRDRRSYTQRWRRFEEGNEGLLHAKLVRIWRGEGRAFACKGVADVEGRRKIVCMLRWGSVVGKRKSFYRKRGCSSMRQTRWKQGTQCPLQGVKWEPPHSAPSRSPMRLRNLEQRRPRPRPGSA